MEMLLFSYGTTRTVAEGFNLHEKHKWVAEVPGMTWRAPFSFSESSKASHTERTGPPAIPQYLRTKQLLLDKTKQRKTKPLQCFFQYVNLPHILMPGHIWKSILSNFPIRFGFTLFILVDVSFECWVFTDEAGVQQDDVRAQDGFDHL